VSWSGACWKGTRRRSQSWPAGTTARWSAWRRRSRQGRFGATGGWVYPPQPWPQDAEERLYAHGARQRIRAALDDLPPGPRRVILLRDIEGLASGEVCELLGIDEASQRLLLHRGRARYRAYERIASWTGPAAGRLAPDHPAQVALEHLHPAALAPPREVGENLNAPCARASGRRQTTDQPTP